MLLEIILLKELLQTPLSGGKFTNLFGNYAELETIVIPVVEPPPPQVEIGAALRALTYPKGWDAQNIVVNITPEEIAIYKESERVKKALRGL